MLKAGQRLKETREKLGLTIADVSQSTKIRDYFLECIEKGEYEKLPTGSFAQGFVRNYASFLNLPEEEILALFRREFDEEKMYRVLPSGMVENSLSFSRIKGSQIFLILILLLSLSGFIFFQYKDAVINPSVSVLTPKENEIINTTSLLVTGKTNSENLVFVNNFSVSLDENGNFKKSISVFPGKNEVKIKVVNKFNKITEISRTIFVKT